MNKNIFITGEAKMTSLLRDYISARMEANICTVDSYRLDEDSLSGLKNADVIILMHEVDRCDGLAAEKNLLFTREIIQNLPKYGYKATIVYFTPQKSSADDDETRALKLEGERIVRDYCTSSGAKPILYRIPELFGPCFRNDVLDRIIAEGKTSNPECSYELLHSDDFIYELYRMVNGAPTLMREFFARPAGAYFATEQSLLRNFESFNNMSVEEIPDFPSPFERALYDYYLSRTRPSGVAKVNGDVVLSSVRFGAVSVIRLQPGEEYTVNLNSASGLRVLLLYGSLKVDDKVYRSNNGILRIDVAKDTTVINDGKCVAVIEIWNHTKS